MAKKIRLDQHLLTKGITSSLQTAQALIMTGNILVDEIKQTKPGTQVSPGSVIRELNRKSKYVSRGGDKLAPVLDTFNLSAKGKSALDIGISTGGFTDYLRQNGTNWVFGIDVGYGQVANKLQQDPNVVMLERCNARELTPETFQALVQKTQPAALEAISKISLVVMDVSFISVTKLLENVAQLTQANTDFVILIKPQFEAQKEEVPQGGIIADPELQQRILDRTQHTLESQGFTLKNKTLAGISGTKGNQESFFHLRYKNI